MQDVEMLTHNNQERRRWAEEYAEELERTDCHVGRRTPRNDKRRGVLRTACTACCMACGGGAAFAGIGLAMSHWLTVAVGTAWAVAFLLTGVHLEEMLEERGYRG